MKLSKIALSLASALATSAAMAAPITVLIDDYNYFAGPLAATLPNASTALGPNGATWLWTSVTPDNAFNRAATSVGMNGSAFIFNNPVDVTSAGTLSYLAGFNYAVLGGTAGTGSFNYSVVSNDLSAGTITPASGTAYVSGAAINLAFSSSGTKAWDASIDQLGVTFECANSASLQGTTFKIGDLKAGACTPPVRVPVPGSLALLGLGGIALGLVARRRSIK